jgi:hypothetical protein
MMKNEGSIGDGLNIHILLQPILNHTYIMFQRDFKEIGDSIIICAAEIELFREKYTQLLAVKIA